MTSLKCIPTVLLLVALLTMMVFQITSLGLHIADLIGKREDQQNGQVGRNESVTQFTTSELKQLSEERKYLQEELNRLKDIIAEVKENTTELIQNLEVKQLLEEDRNSTHEELNRLKDIIAEVKENTTELIQNGEVKQLLEENRNRTQEELNRLKDIIAEVKENTTEIIQNGEVKQVLEEDRNRTQEELNRLKDIIAEVKENTTELIHNGEVKQLLEEDRNRTHEELNRLKDIIAEVKENTTELIQNGEVKQLLEEDRNRTQEELNRLKDIIAEVKENTTELIQNGEVKQLLGEARNRTQEELNRLKNIIAEVKENTSKEIENELNSFAAKLQVTELTLCNISSFNWRRVAYINMTDPEAECPSGLNETSNSTTGQRACGRSVDGAGYTHAAPGGCSSVTFPVNTTYSHVCGYARGYQYRSMDAFWRSYLRTINDAYVDGLSITHGNPRKHLWTLAAGVSELHSTLALQCPRDTDPFDFTRVPDFVGSNFYCETGFIGTEWEERTAWEDPLWDGQQCVSSTAQSCTRYGWFHRDIEPSQEDIEVRWCGDQVRSDEDFYTDLLEIWVL